MARLPEEYEEPSVPLDPDMEEGATGVLPEQPLKALVDRVQALPLAQGAERPWTPEALEELRKMGAKGGRVRAERLSEERRREIGRLGALKRWGRG